MKCRGIAICLGLLITWLNAGAGAAVSSAPPTQQYTCESRVFLYIDKSGSLSTSERQDVSEQLGELLAKQAGTIVSSTRSISVTPFAERSGKTITMQSAEGAEAISKKIIDLFEAELKEVGQSDLSDMVALAQHIGSQIDGLHADTHGVIFIVISDFEHDVTGGHDDPWTRKKDLEDWRTRKSDVLTKLEPKFKNGPMLLLLPVKVSEDALGIGKEVEAELEKLTPYESQVKSIGGVRIDLTSMLHYLEPLTIESKINESARINAVTVVNRSCVKLPKLRIRRKLLLSEKESKFIEEKMSNGKEVDNNGNALDFELDASTKPKEEFSFDVDEALFDPKPATVDGRAPEVMVVVFPVDDKKAIAIADLPVNYDEYVSLERFIGTASKSNGGVLDLGAHFERAYWSGDVSVQLTLLRDDIWPIGYSTKVLLPEGSGAANDTNPKLVKAQVEIGLDKEEGDLESLCDEPLAKKTGLTMRVEVFPPGASVQEHSLPVNVVTNGDNQRDLLENIAQQGSFPAIATLLTLLAIAGIRRQLTLGHVEEILAAAGLLWVTVFLLLHRIPWAAHHINDWLSGKIANRVGAGICLLLIVLVCLLIRLGTIFPAKEISEIDVVIEKDVLTAHNNSLVFSIEPWRKWGRRIWVPLFVASVGWIGYKLWTDDDIPHCALVVEERFQSPGAL